MKRKLAIGCRNSACIESFRGMRSVQLCANEELMAKLSPCAAEMLGALAPSAAIYYRRKCIPAYAYAPFLLFSDRCGIVQPAPEPIEPYAIDFPGDVETPKAEEAIYVPPVFLPEVISAKEQPEAATVPIQQTETGPHMPEAEQLDETAPEAERLDEAVPEEGSGKALEIERPDEAGDELEHITETGGDINFTSYPLESPVNGGNTLSEESMGLLHYKKWWFLRHIDVSVRGEILSGTPIFIEKGTMRLVDKSYSYFIPLSKIDFIRTRDGLDDNEGA